jgi:hypothetical protein
VKLAELPGLPSEVRSLVADGVWSMYELLTEEPRYILLTSRRTEYYFLSSCGDLMQPTPVKSVADLELVVPVTVIGERGGIRVTLESEVRARYGS